MRLSNNPAETRSPASTGPCARAFLAAALCAGIAASPALALPPLDEVVMYEANIRAMSVDGDFAGVVDRLDEIEALGVNTLWLMPFHPVGVERRFGELGSPYSVRDYLDVGEEYGTIDDLHDLIDAAHARGISVLMDWVANHTAWDHAWITDHPEWYTQDAQGNIIHPPGTNWMDVADLNYGNAAMRAEMIDQMVWWVQNTDIDGFRMDAPDFVPHDFWAEAVPAVRASAGRPLLMLAEGARPDHHDAGFDLTFGWRFFTGLHRAFIEGWPAGEIGAGHRAEYDPVPTGKGILRWTTNHDQTAYDAPPPVLFGGLDASLAAYAAMVMHGGTPLIYSGQEVGSTDNTEIVERDPIDWTTNPAVEDWYAWIIGVRRQHAAIRTGSVADHSTSDALLLARTLGDERVAAMINVRGHPVSFTVPPAFVSAWTDIETGQTQHLEGGRTLQPYETRLYTLETWPGLVVSGALQTEQGDPADWDPAGSSLVLDRDGPRYTVRAHNLGNGTPYGLEIISDRGQPPVDATDPRLASDHRAYGDADGSVTITVDLGEGNNIGEPVVWIDTDAAPLQAVGSFMNEAGGAGDWNPADPAFAMTPLGQGRYVYDATLSTPGDFEFKTSFGQGWTHQVGTDGYNDNARTLNFSTTAPGQQIRLFADLRARRLEAWVGLCTLDRNGDLRLDMFDVLDLLAAVDAGQPGADVNGDGSVDQQDVFEFLGAMASGCG